MLNPTRPLTAFLLILLMGCSVARPPEPLRAEALINAEEACDDLLAQLDDTRAERILMQQKVAILEQELRENEGAETP